MDGEWEHKNININGVKTHYLAAGHGEETILLIHGGMVWSCAELEYGPILNLLGRSMRVIAVDIPGFGLTPGRGLEDYMESGQGEFLIGFLHTLDAIVHIGGNSAGGWLSTYIALEAPDLLKSLTIINSGSTVVAERRDDTEDRYDPRWAVPGSSPSEEDVQKELIAFYHRKHIVTDERIRKTREYAVRNYDFAVKRQMAQGLTSQDRNKRLQYKGRHISTFANILQVPVLLTWSRENRGAKPEQALPFFNGLEDAEMHIFVEAGHHVHLEHPERWSDVVTSFIHTHRRSS